MCLGQRVYKQAGYKSKGKEEQLTFLTKKEETVMGTAIYQTPGWVGPGRTEHIQGKGEQ